MQTKHCRIEHQERYEGKPFWSVFVGDDAVLTLRGPDTPKMQDKIKAVALAIDEAIDAAADERDT